MHEIKVVHQFKLTPTFIISTVPFEFKDNTSEVEEDELEEVRPLGLVIRKHEQVTHQFHLEFLLVVMEFQMEER
jgi:hypothetical protein